MHERVAVDLGGGCQEELGALCLGQTERVVGAERADLEGLDRHLEVVDGRRWRCKVHDGVDVAGDPDVVGDIGLHEGEPGVAEEVFDVPGVAGDEVVDGDDFVAACEQCVGNVTSQESGSAGDNDAGHQERPIPW